MASRLPFVFVLAFGSGVLASCLAGSDDDEGSSNAGSGGAAAGSSAGGGSGGATGGSAGSGTGGATTGGTSGSGTGGVACCLAIPVCSDAETEVSGPDACAPGASCRELSLCCSTIWCASRGGVAGAGGTGGDPAGCNPDEEPDRNYLGSTEVGCEMISDLCPMFTSPFMNDCGCGCEQDESCPDFVDCMPGPDPRPGCTADERARCPYTDVAF